MNSYRIDTCIIGYVVYQSDHRQLGQQSLSWAFTTAEEAADKVLELMKAEEAADAPA